MIMGLFDKIIKNFTQDELISNVEEGAIYSPADGELITLSDVGDGVFSAEILGKGCGLRPSEGRIYAPFDGKVIQVSDTKHAIGLISEDGVETLIHVGIDTVNMQGKGFVPKVQVNNHVKYGQLLMLFSIPEIQKAGYNEVISIIVTNTGDYEDIEFVGPGKISKSEKILFIKK